MLPLLLALAVPPASACDGTNKVVSYEVWEDEDDDDDCDCEDHVVVLEKSAEKTSAPERAPDHHALRFQVAALQADEAPWLAGQFRLVGRKDAYIGVEGRIGAEGAWAGRVGAGFDLLGKSDWDLKLGMFLGGVGVDWEREEALVVGTEVGAGARIGRLYGTYRWLLGLGTRYPAAADVHTEHEFILGFRVLGELRVFGQATYARPGSGYGATALGLGVQFRI